MKTSGYNILDEAGNIVKLRGCTFQLRLSNKEQKFAALKDLGVNYVNFQLVIDDFTSTKVIVDPSDPYWDTSGFAAMDKALAWCEKYGMRALLTWHIWSEIPPRTLPATQIWPAPGDFLVNKALQDDWIARWKLIIPKYANHPTVIGFDLLTEPYCIKWNSGSNFKPPAGDADLAWENILKRGITELHPLAPDKLLFCEGFNDPVIGTFKDTAFWSTKDFLVWDNHYYYDDKTSWKPAEQAYAKGDFTNGKTLLRKQLTDEYLQFKIPAVVGEFGYEMDEPNWSRHMADWLSLVNELGLGASMYTFGAKRWGISYDISLSDTTFELDQSGQAYKSNLIGYPASKWPTSKPPEPPQPDPRTITIDITAPKDVTVQVNTTYI